MQARSSDTKATDPARSSIRRATLLYWVLLLYVIAALIWWFLSLESLNQEMYELRKRDVILQYSHPQSPDFIGALQQIEENRRRATTKYVAEGITFLALIIIGAFYVYRLVRRQFQVQRQQQNFVMAITHELKTPIAASRLNLETLQKHHLDEARRGKLMQMTLQETLRLETLINNILLSAQLEGASYQMSHEELDFSRLVGDVVSQFASRYPDRQLIREIEPELEINGDPLLLKLLVSNLLENAQKYSPREKPIRLLLLRRGKAVQLQVIDEGPGIAEEEKKRVFRKFYRIGNEQTRRTKGTGLGLFLSRKIVQDHGGSIVIADNQPTGSNFTITFPA